MWASEAQKSQLKGMSGVRRRVAPRYRWANYVNLTIRRTELSPFRAEGHGEASAQPGAYVQPERSEASTD